MLTRAHFLKLSREWESTLIDFAARDFKLAGALLATPDETFEQDFDSLVVRASPQSLQPGLVSIRPFQKNDSFYACEPLFDNRACVEGVTAHSVAGRILEDIHGEGWNVVWQVNRALLKSRRNTKADELQEWFNGVDRTAAAHEKRTGADLV